MDILQLDKTKVRLEGTLVNLLPLEEEHFTDLQLLAAEKRIWEFYPTDMSTAEKRLEAFSKALTERDKGTQFPFVIFNKQQNNIIGSTRLMEIHPAHKKLEIGWTWLAPGCWGTAINSECKLMLLAFCFEKLKANRVQFRTDENNIRSRKAIAKTGAQYEGILRNDWIKDNGTIRSTAHFSILNSEWEAVKIKLTEAFQHKMAI